MCLLNGDIAGAIPHLTDFGVEEYDDGETVTYTNIKIHTILMEMLQNFGNELVQNIVINDLEEHGLDLLEYRGDIPLYLIRDIDADLIRNITPKDIDCIIIDGNIPTQISDTKQIRYDTLSNLSD
jgi:hypothetical protein